MESYKTFSKDSFKEKLNNELLNININNVDFSDFNYVFRSVLNKHTPKR